MKQYTIAEALVLCEHNADSLDSGGLSDLVNKYGGVIYKKDYIPAPEDVFGDYQLLLTWVLQFGYLWVGRTGTHEYERSRMAFAAKIGPVGVGERTFSNTIRGAIIGCVLRMFKEILDRHAGHSPGEKPSIN